MTSHILLVATVDAAASSTFQLTKPSDGQVVALQVIGLAGTEKAYLQIEDYANPDTFVNLLINGSEVYCDVGNNIITFSMAGKFRINKDASVAAVAVCIMSDKEVLTY